MSAAVRSGQFCPPPSPASQPLFYSAPRATPTSIPFCAPPFFVLDPPLLFPPRHPRPSLQKGIFPMLPVFFPQRPLSFGLLDTMPAISILSFVPSPCSLFSPFRSPSFSLLHLRNVEIGHSFAAPPFFYISQSGQALPVSFGPPQFPRFVFLSCLPGRSHGGIGLIFPLSGSQYCRNVHHDPFPWFSLNAFLFSRRYFPSPSSTMRGARVFSLFLCLRFHSAICSSAIVWYCFCDFAYSPFFFCPSFPLKILLSPFGPSLPETRCRKSVCACRFHSFSRLKRQDGPPSRRTAARLFRLISFPPPPPCVKFSAFGGSDLWMWSDLYPSDFQCLAVL